jgi:hypothetical protein
MEAVQEASPIPSDRDVPILTRACVIEFEGVAFDSILGDPELGIPTAQQHLLTQGTAEMVDSLVERVSGVGVVEIGPKHGEENIAPDESSRGSQGEVGQEGQAFGLHQDGGKAHTSSRYQADGAKRSEPDDVRALTVVQGGIVDGKPQGRGRVGRIRMMDSIRLPDQLASAIPPWF